MDEGPPLYGFQFLGMAVLVEFSLCTSSPSVCALTIASLVVSVHTFPLWNCVEIVVHKRQLVW